ncbi:hypothetical protein [Sulfuricystis multivorans]|uniref:hypothetical protein n=1 Tax=Sulfuricystis multivorans TaxID=2211108 RepID=UPI000F83FDD9|nr:hypothetical protein [Sulfuricystis multivorans]
MKYPRIALVISAFVALSYSTSSAASPIEVSLDALKFVVKNQTSIAASFAVAHTQNGSGEPGSRVCGPKVSETGDAVSCNTSDFFNHQNIGNDTAISDAFGISWALGFRGEATAHASVLKGDFAAAGAYARGGAAVTATDGSLGATGMTKATASFSLGGLTLRASKKDPELYSLLVSDLPLWSLPEDFFDKEISGISHNAFITLPPSLSKGVPDHIFWALDLLLDGASGQLTVSNYGLSVTSPLTSADFIDLSTAAESVYQLSGSGDFTIDIPFLDLNAPEQVITFDEMSLTVAAMPEPTSLLLVFLGLACIAGIRTTRLFTGFLR